MPTDGSELRHHYSPPTPAELFIRDLDKRIDWHRKNHNDPHQIGTAAYAILSEVRDAFAVANKLPLAPR